MRRDSFLKSLSCNGALLTVYPAYGAPIDFCRRSSFLKVSPAMKLWLLFIPLNCTDFVSGLLRRLIRGTNQIQDNMIMGTGKNTQCGKVRFGDSGEGSCHKGPFLRVVSRYNNLSLLTGSMLDKFILLPPIFLNFQQIL